MGRAGQLRMLWNDCRSSGLLETVYRALDLTATRTGWKERRNPAGWMSDQEVISSFPGVAGREELCSLLRRRLPASFGAGSPSGLREMRELLRKHFPEDCRKTISTAEKILRHEFDLLGSSFNFPGAIDWAWHGADRPWPSGHWSKIALGGPGLMDIKPVWELNRHQHLLTLGRAYWMTGEESYAREMTSQLASWLEQNPPETGINWQSNLEIALRSLSWVWAFYFLLPSAALTDDFLFDWARAFLHNGLHLARNIGHSRRLMRNNHLIGDAAGLAVLAMFLPELQYAPVWKKTALQILYNELPRQVNSDGVSSEQSTGYQRFVLELYLQVVLWQRRSGEKVPAQIWSYLEKMLEFIAWIIKPGGKIPALGDGDEGRGYRLSEGEAQDGRPLLSTGALLWQRGDFKQAAGAMSEETLWLLGPGALEEWQALPAAEPLQHTRLFPAGGFAVARSGWGQADRFLLFHCGPHSKYHSHAGQLHLELSAFGEDLLVDPGTYTYNGDRAWRDYFRGTFAHNTMAVDGVSQAIPYRAFRWLAPWKVLPLRLAGGRHVAWLEGGHTGYHRLPDPVTHRRAILVLKGEYYLVFDTFEAQEEHTYETLFHLAPGKACFLPGGGCLYQARGEASLLILPLGAGNEPILLEGQVEPFLQGWFSPGYGVREPSPVLSYQTRKVGAWLTGYLLYPFSSPEGAGEVEFLGEPGGMDCLAGTVRQGKKEDFFSVRFEAASGRWIVRGLGQEGGFPFG